MYSQSKGERCIDVSVILLIRTTGTAEKVTQQEQGEEMAFLEAVTVTPPMQYVHQYLARKVTLTLLLCSCTCCL